MSDVIVNFRSGRKIRKKLVTTIVAGKGVYIIYVLINNTPLLAGCAR